MTCPTKIPTDVNINFMSKGLSNKFRHTIMCVVNKNNFKVSNSGMSRVPIIVNNMMIAIEIIIGPMELSVKQESNSDSAATTCKLKKAMAKAHKNRHNISFSRNITICSVFKTTKSPFPKIHNPTPKDKIPNHVNNTVR